MKKEKKQKVNFGKAEKITLKQFFGIFKNIQLPWLLLILAIVCEICYYVIALFSVELTADIIDNTNNYDFAKLMRYAIIAVSSALFAVCGYTFSGIASEKINLGLRNKLWNKMIHVTQKVYDMETGETLVSRVTTDCDSASTLFSTCISSITLVIGTVMYLVQMFEKNTTLAGYMFLLIPATILAGWIYGKVMYWIGQKTQNVLADSTTYLIERTRNLDLIKASNTQQKEVIEGNAKFDLQYQIDHKSALATVFGNVLTTGINTFGIIITFALGSRLVSEEIMSVGDVLAFYLIMISLTGNCGSFFNSFGSIRNASGCISKIAKVLEYPEDDLETGKDMDISNEDICLNSISFSYDERPVLTDVTCVIPKNKITAVIGANGEGKTTLFKLLERLYTPNNGVMTFGTFNAEDFNLTSWRKAFALVDQDCRLMEGSVKENITYGCKRHISEEELIAVAKQAQVYDFVKDLPNGFDTQVGINGSNFSGGQRQCIAIARAIMRNPDYLLLDEATSNLDSMSERMVNEAIRNLTKNRTTIVIAHTLSVIKNADNVILLKNGKVEMFGTPEDVLRKSAEYRDEAVVSCKA